MQAAAVPVAAKAELMVSSVLVTKHAPCSSLFVNFLNITKHSLTYADITKTTEHRNLSIIPTSEVYYEVTLVLSHTEFHKNQCLQYWTHNEKSRHMWLATNRWMGSFRTLTNICISKKQQETVILWSSYRWFWCLFQSQSHRFQQLQHEWQFAQVRLSCFVQELSVPANITS
jgi:hypothetical protein